MLHLRYPRYAPDLLILLRLELLKLSSSKSKKKHAAQITFHASRSCHLRSLLKEIKAPKFYQINIFETLKFIHKTKQGINPSIFLHQFREVDHQYPTTFSKNSFYDKRCAYKTTSFVINLRGLTNW